MLRSSNHEEDHRCLHCDPFGSLAGHWRIAQQRAKDFVAAINRRGGDATFISLPEQGFKGNTHAAFADLNNLEIAAQLEDWLASKGLDRADTPHTGPKPLHKQTFSIPLAN